MFIVALLALSLTVADVSAQRFRQTSVPPVIITGGVAGSCPSQQQRYNARQALRNTVADLLNLSSMTAAQCGPGQWTRVAYLDMTNPSQSCPSAWQLLTGNGVRVCGRPSSSINMCHGTFYPTGHAYTKVCGRVIGYQVGQTDAFASHRTIDQAYVDGVSITRGSPRTHVWTLTAG